MVEIDGWMEKWMGRMEGIGWYLYHFRVSCATTTPACLLLSTSRYLSLEGWYCTPDIRHWVVATYLGVSRQRLWTRKQQPPSLLITQTCRYSALRSSYFIYPCTTHPSLSESVLYQPTPLPLVITYHTLPSSPHAAYPHPAYPSTQGEEKKWFLGWRRH